MKKKIQTYSQNFKMPCLFREDLENIEEIIKKELNPGEYKLDLGSFEYQEVKEILENIDPINELHIQTSSPCISIDFTKFSSRIYVGDDDIKTVGAVKKITDIILKKERRWLWRFSKSAEWLPPLLFFSIIQLLAWDSARASSWFIIVIILILLVIWWIIGYQSSLKKFSIIEFGYKKNKSNFFIKNKDTIIVNIIVALTSILATIFFQKLLK